MAKQVTEESLKAAFADTLDKGTSCAGIVVSYSEGEQTRTVIGIPYSLTNDTLVIGPYIKDVVTAPPADHDKQKKQIQISNIVGFRRIELTDILKKETEQN